MSSNSPRPDDNEELVHEDDKIVGKASGYSALVLVFMLALVGGIALFLKRPKEQGPEIKTAISDRKSVV